MDALLADAERGAGTRGAAPDFPGRLGRAVAGARRGTERLGRAWGAVSHLNAVADTPSCAPPTTRACRASPSSGPAWAPTSACTPSTRRSTPTPSARARRAAPGATNALRNFVLGGAELQRRGASERFAQIQERQAELSQKFSEHALDATDAFAYYVDAEELDGVPTTCVQAARAAAAAEGQRRLQAHAEDAVLPAGDAVRAQPRAARDALPRLRHARQRPGRRRSSTTPR